jgi:hypothetical protein
MRLTFKAKADSSNRNIDKHAIARTEILKNLMWFSIYKFSGFAKELGIQAHAPRGVLILASVEFGIISSLAARPAWRQMRATLK